MGVLLMLGLSTEQVIEQRKKYGINTLPNKKRRTYLHIILGIAKEPMIFLLILAMVLYLIFGEAQEGISLSIFVIVIITISIYQEGKTEHALQSLRKLSSPNAVVIRNNEVIHIKSEEVVVDDIVILYEGDRIPADGVLQSANDLLIDESLLTGESLPVSKTVTNDNDISVFSGTMVVQGQGQFQVKKIGKHTEIGKIGIELETLKPEPSPLQIQIKKLVQIFSIIGILICLTLVILLGLLKGNWLNASLAGLALAMSLLPEEFPVILTVFPALGAWRLSKQKILTRRISTIETLGAISALCVDKTGTLTENKMSVTQLWANNIFQDIHLTSPKELENDFKILSEYAILASEIEPLDPIEKACHQLDQDCFLNLNKVHHNWTLIQEYDRTPEFPVKTHAWKNPNLSNYILAAKGAPEAIISLCKLSNEHKNQILQAIKKMGEQGLRILSVAKGTHTSTIWPASQKDLSFEFLGLVGVSDPIRVNIQQSIQICHEAGINVIMITGDFSETAKAIAKQAGLKINNVITGPEIKAMSHKTLAEKLKTTSICARITPELKLKIIQALKINGHIVAMTGDGVNDAPALKAAHVGIAMGNRGTDVAREASSLILLDDNFSSIVNAIQLGRRIFDNIKKSMCYILAVHVPIAGMALLPVLLNWPILFYPIHVAFLQLLIDPICSIAFENEPAEINSMQKPPRNTNRALLGKKTILYSFLQGLGILGIVFYSYYWALEQLSEPQARTFAFMCLIIANLILIIANRSSGPVFKSIYIANRLLLSISLIILLCLFFAIYIPFLAKLFYFSVLPISLIIKSILLGFCSIIWFELLKKISA